MSTTFGSNLKETLAVGAPRRVKRKPQLSTFRRQPPQHNRRTASPPPPQLGPPQAAAAARSSPGYTSDPGASPHRNAAYVSPQRLRRPDAVVGRRAATRRRTSHYVELERRLREQQAGGLAAAAAAAQPLGGASAVRGGRRGSSVAASGGGGGGSPARHPRFTDLPPSPVRSPEQEFAERMETWRPDLPFPFQVDLTEYDPDGSNKMIAFEQQRSEEAHTRYLQMIERAKDEEGRRRRMREDEARRVRDRTLEREAEQLREAQQATERLLADERWREERLRVAMEREAARVAQTRRQRAEAQRAEEELDGRYEEQIAALRERGRNQELFASRAATRHRLKEALDRTLEETLGDAEETRRALEAEAVQKVALHEDALREEAEARRKEAQMHEAMELGRTMRLAGVKRADQAMELGLIGAPCPIPLP